MSIYKLARLHYKWETINILFHCRNLRDKCEDSEETCHHVVSEFICSLKNNVLFQYIYLYIFLPYIHTWRTAYKTGLTYIYAGYIGARIHGFFLIFRTLCFSFSDFDNGYTFYEKSTHCILQIHLTWICFLGIRHISIKYMKKC